MLPKACGQCEKLQPVLLKSEKVFVRLTNIPNRCGKDEFKLKAAKEDERSQTNDMESDGEEGWLLMDEDGRTG